VPAYIGWQRYLENRAQLRLNAAKRRGSVRTGVALLSGLLVCVRCGLRMNSAYNHNGRGPRYICGNMKSTYDAPFCQTLSAPPLDALISRLALEAVQPAALEVSLAVAADVEAERAAVEQHWQQRLEWAGYQPSGPAANTMRSSWRTAWWRATPLPLTPSPLRRN
jgi:hypothetical protein